MHNSNLNPNHKRHQFQKDLDKMMSGDYVLVPIQANDAMLLRANQYFHASNYGTDAHTLIKNLWNVMIGQVLHERLAPQNPMNGDEQ